MIDRNAKLPEDDRGATVFSVDPLIVKEHYEADYYHSYAQDSEFFRALGRGVLLGSECKRCRVRYATPRAHCMRCGGRTEWFQLPPRGRVHTFTTCYFGSEEFLNETPYNLVMVEFDGVDTLFLGRLVGASTEDIYVGMPVRARFRRLQRFRVTDVYFVPE
ncbi:hypothetical protein GCM10007108_14840 [Thermogymnomonas acidicola]|uniref:ChsH2 C-terminal OB-fold domain-containing protein n=1 Tax=Thermogymnomonas acidicola TaxID=399579 RepID=A0AA37F9V1_9ARCH|nr:Zn-ribbon domain-containing OB-fold protein [Thermogymnomonas acidicola]GGM77734.1 hypothetical protein GCM10007108_14840 [Thermogymnomonas acidicola]